MEANDKAFVLRHLEEGREVLAQSLRGVSDEVAAIPPAEGRWSILEIIEHLAIAEFVLLSKVSTTEPSEQALIPKEREAAILVRGPDRTKKFVAPDYLTPKRKFTTIASALANYDAVRLKTLAFLDAANGDLRLRHFQHPLLGMINGYESMLIIAFHAHRHAQQIDEIVAAQNPL